MTTGASQVKGQTKRKSLAQRWNKAGLLGNGRKVHVAQVSGSEGGEGEQRGHPKDAGTGSSSSKWGLHSGLWRCEAGSNTVCLCCTKLLSGEGLMGRRTLLAQVQARDDGGLDNE
jgi:hypothetical protein